MLLVILVVIFMFIAGAVAVGVYIGTRGRR